MKQSTKEKELLAIVRKLLSKYDDKRKSLVVSLKKRASTDRHLQNVVNVLPLLTVKELKQMRIIVDVLNTPIVGGPPFTIGELRSNDAKFFVDCCMRSAYLEDINYV